MAQGAGVEVRLKLEDGLNRLKRCLLSEAYRKQSLNRKERSARFDKLVVAVGARGRFPSASPRFTKSYGVFPFFWMELRELKAKRAAER